MFNTALTRRLRLNHPIILAPMGGIAGGALAAAVSAAGGLGMIGVGHADVPWIEAQLDLVGNTPVGAGFITWRLAERPWTLDAVLAWNPPAIMLSFGDPAPWVKPIKDRGAALICQVQRVSEAIEVVRLGADVVVVQGQEAGGHGRSGRGLMGLIPAAIEAVKPVPVVAAGAVVDGRGLAGALMLGADGVLIGTRFQATPEALCPEAVKRRLIAGRADDTVRTRCFDVVRGEGWPRTYNGRALANDFTARWGTSRRGLEGELLEAERSALAQAEAEGDTTLMPVWAGEGVDLIDSIEPAGRIIQRMVREAARRMDKS